jgi:hypothetical protein
VARHFLSAAGIAQTRRAAAVSFLPVIVRMTAVYGYWKTILMHRLEDA